jgi:hypothetical protein
VAHLLVLVDAVCPCEILFASFLARGVCFVCFLLAELTGHRHMGTSPSMSAAGCI